MSPHTEQYRGHELRFVAPEGRVAVFKGDAETFSTSSQFSSREDAFAAARGLVDTALAGHPVTPPVNDPAA